MNKDGEMISLAEDMSEDFNKFFISVFTNEGNEKLNGCIKDQRMNSYVI